METKHVHICPWWAGYILINPLRQLYHHPVTMLSPYIKPGMKVVDYGCAMGYFSLPMAKLVGEEGRVYSIDIQKKMIDQLFKRALKAKLEDIISPILITKNTDFAELKGKIDFALLFYMVHEVPDKNELFSNMSKMIKPGGTILFVEPRGHVTLPQFEDSERTAFDSGFGLINHVNIRGAYASLLVRKNV